MIPEYKKRRKTEAYADCPTNNSLVSFSKTQIESQLESTSNIQTTIDVLLGFTEDCVARASLGFTADATALFEILRNWLTTTTHHTVEYMNPETAFTQTQIYNLQSRTIFLQAKFLEFCEPLRKLLPGVHLSTRGLQTELQNLKI